MYQYAELVHWMRSNDSRTILPTMADIDLTNLCNQDCYYCNTADFRRAKPVQLPYQHYINLLDRLSQWQQHSPNSFGKIHAVEFTGGGEPTLLKHYEQVIEHSIDLDFQVGMMTNGSRLHQLIDNVSHDKIRKIDWIGVDIDAATPDLYEKIRRSKTPDIMNKMIENVKRLTAIGANVDFKILVGEHNHDHQCLRDIFQLAKDCQVRMVMFRPMQLGQNLFDLQQVSVELQSLASQYDVYCKISETKMQKRNYSKCHQMYQYPVFSADGQIYLCCENKGNPRFSIGSWVDGDFRDKWLSKRHHDIYQSVNTRLCAPCGPNRHNNEIQKIIDDPHGLEHY